MHQHDDLINTNSDMGLLRALLDKEILDKYRDILQPYMLTKLSWDLTKDFIAYYKDYPNETKIDPTKFEPWFRLERHSEWKTDKHIIYKTIFDNLFAPTKEVPKEVIQKIGEHRAKEQVQKLLDTGEYAKSIEVLNDLSNLKSKGKVELVTDSVESLLTQATRDNGIRWRLEDLNQSVGPIDMGDLIVVGKRPETGGTSFLISEMTYMVPQLPEGKHALLINNEEHAPKIATRLVTCAIGCKTIDAYNNPKASQDAYHKFLGTKRIDILSQGVMDINSIDKLLSSGDYGLIGINVLEKLDIKGKKLEDFQKLEQLGLWARRKALENGPVFAIVQASAEAEGVKYPDQTMLYKTKTGLQAEADVLLMLGRVSDGTVPESSRFISIAKNKLPGTKMTNPTYRHMKNEVHFDIDTGRFTSLTWTKVTK